MMSSPPKMSRLPTAGLCGTEEAITSCEMPCAIIAPMSELHIAVDIGTWICHVLKPHNDRWAFKRCECGLTIVSVQSTLISKAVKSVSY